MQLAQANSVVSFDIPAQALSGALIALGQQADLQISFDPAVVSGLTAAAVTGNHPVGEALGLLLQGTGLTYRFTDSGTVAVTKVATQGSNETVLEPITVQAKGETATGPVDGYVATRSGSASKTDTPLIETPRSVSVITADEMEERKVRNVEEALSYTSGVQVSPNGNDPRFDQINVRGFAVTSNADFRDGLKQSNTGWLSYFYTQPYALERVEVVKGPNSVLYGQVSPGGMVNRISKRPTEEALHEVELQVGTDQHHQGQFDLSGPVSEDGEWLYRLTGLAKESKSDLVGVIDDNLYLSPQVTWKPTEDTKVTVFGEAQERETAGSTRPYQYSSGVLSYFWTGDEDFDGLKQSQYLAGYEVEHSFNNTFTARQSLRFGDVDTENQYLTSSLQADGHTFNRTAYGVYEDMQSVVADTSLQSDFATGPIDHTVITGLDVSKIDAHVEYLSGSAPTIDMNNPNYHQSINKPSNYITHQDIDATQMGLYAQDQLSWDKWRFSLGLRHDWTESDKTNLLTGVTTNQKDEATTGSVGLVYLFDNGVAPYASYATSFIPEVGTDLYGNAYKPTEGEMYEVGVKYQPQGSKGYITASLFDLTEQNVKTTDPDNSSNQIQTGEQRARGLELEARMELSADTSLIATYTYQDIEITKSTKGDEGNTPSGKPEHMVSAWATHSVPDGMFAGFELGAGGRWIGSSYKTNDNDEKNDDYAIFDARVAYDLDKVIPGTTFAVNATNLTDNDYVMCVSGYCYRGRGRSIIASINYQW